jgi:hypothetical protein
MTPLEPPIPSDRSTSSGLAIELVRVRAAARRSLEAIAEVERLRPEDDWRYRTTVSIAAATIRGELEGALARTTVAHAVEVPRGGK